MADISIRMTADGSAVVSAVQQSNAALQSLGVQAAQTGASINQIQQASSVALGPMPGISSAINAIQALGAQATQTTGAVQSASVAGAEGFRRMAEEADKGAFATVGAKRELMVLGHEAMQGNFSKIPGSLMVLAERMDLTTMLMSPMVLGIVAASAAAVGLAVVIAKGAQSQREMNDALIMTGNYAGTTSDGLNELAHVAAAAGGSLGEAKKVVTELAASGKYTADQIGLITDAVIAVEHATGGSDKSTEKLIKQFETLAVQTGGSSLAATRAISNATLKLDDEYHFLTESVFEQIHTLEKEDNQKEASKLATEAFAKVTSERAEQMVRELGVVAQTWSNIKKIISLTGDEIGKIGKKSTDASEVARLTAKVADLSPAQDLNGQVTPYAAGTRAAIAQATAVDELRKAQERLDNTNDVALQQGEYQKRQSTASHAAALITAEDQKLQKKGLSELEQATTQYLERVSIVRAANANSELVTDQAVSDHLAALKKLHSERDVKPKGTDTRAQELADALILEKIAMDREKELYTEREKMLSTYHSKLGLSDADYYAGREVAREDYLKSLKDSYAKERDLIADSPVKTPVEQAAKQRQLDALYEAYQKTYNSIAKLSNEDALSQIADMQKVIDAATKSGEKALSQLDAQIAKQREHNAEIGKSKDQIDLARQAQEEAGTAALETQAKAYQSALDNTQASTLQEVKDRELYTQKLYYLTAEIDKRRQIAGLFAEGAVKEVSAAAAKKSEEAWASANKSIGDGLYSALANGGDSALKKLLKDAKEWFARLVLSPIVQPIAALGASIMNPTAASATPAGVSAVNTVSNISSAVGATSFAGAFSSGAAIGTEAFSAGVTMMTEATGLTSFMAGAGQMLGAVGPVGWAAMAAMAVLSMADHGTPTSNTGSNSRAFDASGNVTGSENYYGGTSASADAMIVKMQDAYMQGAKSLGIATVASSFNFSGNTGKNGESPNFALGGGAGGKSFQQGETKLDDAAMALAASRAVFAALQGSELPVYLAGVFDSVTASTATQEQITAAIAGAQALAAWHTALTALPFDTLTNASYSTIQGLIGAAGGLDKLSGNLAGFYANFYSSDEKTAALTKSTTAAFADLGLVMPAIDASTRSAYRSMIEELGAKDLSVEANAKAYTGALALQSAVNELAPAASAAKSSVKDLSKEMTGFDAAGLGKMILDAAFNPQAGMSAAESFAQALQYSVQNALISSTVGQISDTLYTSIIMPIVAGNAVAQGAMDAVVADATAKLDALGQLFESDTFKSAIGSIATTVAGIMPSLTPMAAYTAPVAYVAPVVDTKAADAAKAAADALAQSLKSLGDTSKSLAIELLRAQGQQAQADAAQRAIDIAGYSDAEIAVYDYNTSLRAQITAIGAAKTANEALVAAENAASAAREAAAQKSIDTANAGAKTALDTLSRAVNAQKKLVSDAYDAASKSTQTALDGVTASVGKLQTLATSLKSTLDGMRIAGSDGAYRQDAQTQIRAALETARAGGGLPIDGTLTSALATVAKPSEQLFGSFTAYALDFYRTANDIADLSVLTSDALSADEMTQVILRSQLTALKTGFDAENARLDAVVTGAQAQLNALNGVNDSVLSVESAISSLSVAMTALANAQKAVVVLPSASLVDQQGATLQAAIAAGDTATIGATAYDMLHAGLSSFAIGTNFVPSDMIANIHAGERIIPAADNRELMQRLQNPGDNNAVLVAEIRALRAEVAGLRASSERGNESAQRTADTLSGRQGVPFLVQVAA